MLNKYTSIKLNTNFVILLYLLCIREIASYQCYRCHGSDCQDESKLKDTVECAYMLDDCVSVFGEFNILERGCYSSLPKKYRNKCDEYNTTLCHRCFQDKCNDRGPSNCVQCNSKDDWNCFRDPVDIEATYCPIAVEVNNYCFVRYNMSGFMERGCLSSRQEERDCEKSFTCKSCLPNASVACNNIFQPMIVNDASHVQVYSLFIAVASLVAFLLK